MYGILQKREEVQKGVREDLRALLRPVQMRPWTLQEVHQLGQSDVSWPIRPVSQILNPPSPYRYLLLDCVISVLPFPIVSV